jgi:hypothetical protein
VKLTHQPVARVTRDAIDGLIGKLSCAHISAALDMTVSYPAAPR